MVITVNENDNGSITIIANATYEDDGSPVVNYPVEFILDDKIIGTGVTNRGIATLIVPANKIIPGPHKITVKVIGNENTNNGTASTIFTKTNKINETNKTSKNPATANVVAMKEIGMSIIVIIIVLIGLIVLIGRKKKRKKQ
ncbi:hypothetical protein ALNOE001_01310 [Candidatus Methanobinarius endosymbioticus]|uniref:Bacterial Ig-like domain-containing protein n=1 Tax=Candidatus Methanobinarius endosymbioticus TaxID=2006182 RepID=A0A366MFW0_9EURY|nr:hypothetical protein ALNOE001_01310 [Candidatus Methanobinarius endosymbioticus]